MSVREFRIKTGATRPVYEGVLLDHVGTRRERPISLEDVDSVFLILRLNEGDEPALNEEMEVVGDPEDGLVRYEWQAGDTDAPGRYEVESKILWSDGGIEYVPNGAYETVVITQSLES